MQGLYEESATRTGNGQPHKTKSKPKKTNPLAVHLGGLQNLLRLRTNYRFNEKLSCQVGADLNLQQQSVFPAGTLQYEVTFLHTFALSHVVRADYDLVLSAKQICKLLNMTLC